MGDNICWPTLAVILAAGQGTRMRSPLPKVMHAVGNRPLLGHVLAAVEAAGYRAGGGGAGCGRAGGGRLSAAGRTHCAAVYAA